MRNRPPRSELRSLAGSAISLTALLLTAGPALAQSAAPPPSTTAPSSTTAAPATAAPAGEQLPPVIIETTKEPEPPAPKEASPQPAAKPPKAAARDAPPTPKKKPTAAAKPQPQSVPAPASGEPTSAAPLAATAGGSSPQAANPLANPGTPAAGVVPVLGAIGSPGAQPATGIDTTKLANDPLFSVTDVLRQSPGVSLKQGNGPRDIGISIRGSNARNGFGVRNIVIMEDGFPVTQPDGLSRTDLVDPHAYGGIDVWRGPSSALFGNYATGGALNFRLKQGRDINGAEAGSDFGSFNYFSNYVAVGGKSENVEATLFASDVRGDGYFEYSAFDTQTIHFLMKYQATPSDTFTFKAINNELDTELPFRTSLTQLTINPYQQNCRAAGGSVAAAGLRGCAALNYSATGNPNTPGARVAQTAEQAGANRDDRRTIGGVRWDHEFSADTTGRLQFVIDDRNISQPTGTTSAEGDFLSYNAISGITHKADVAGLPATYHLGFFWNYLPVDSKSYNVAPGPESPLGLLQSETIGYTMNFGGRARQEIEFTDDWSVIAGLGVEKTLLHGQQKSYRYNVAGVQTARALVRADRDFVNVAPEFGLLYRPNDFWQARGRVGTGYGTPQFTNLFVTSTGDPGNNTDLESQRNIGWDLGVDFTPAPGFSFSLTGFYEFFKDELVSQGTVPGRSNTSFNVPKSEHRGIEASIDVKVAEGWRLTTAYLYNDQIYTEYTERLTRAAGGGNPARVADLDRAGNNIPGVAPHELTARLGYDVPFGLFEGLGAFAEYQWTDEFFMDNGNLLKAPSFESVNLNVHYHSDLAGGFIRSLDMFFEVKNLLDVVNLGAANNLASSLDGRGNENGANVLRDVSGSIYAGAPRTYYGGVKMKF